MRDFRIPSIIGFVGGLIASGITFIISDTFGLPGSEAYRIYQAFNRTMAVLLLMQAFALVGFNLHFREFMGRFSRSALFVALLGWIGMSAGTAAEFWLYSDLAYGEENMRSAAFSFFSLSSLVADLAFLALGLRAFVNRQVPKFIAVVMILYLPFDIALFLAGQSIFQATALVSTAVAFFTLRNQSAKTDFNSLGT